MTEPTQRECDNAMVEGFESPKSQCKCIDCNLPELETLSYKPPKPVKTGFLGLNANIIKPEQPNTELLIVKTIQGLTTCINNELEKLYINKLNEVIYQKQAGAKARALEAINSFEKTMFELQKAFE